MLPPIAALTEVHLGVSPTSLQAPGQDPGLALPTTSVRDQAWQVLGQATSRAGMTAPLWSMDLSLGPGPCSCGHLSVPPSLSDHLQRTQVTVHNHLLPELELQLPRPGVEGEGQLVSRSRAPSAPLPSPLLIIHSPSPRSPPSWNLRSQPESIRHVGNLRPRKKVRPLPGIENRAGVIAVPCHLCHRPRPQPVRPPPPPTATPSSKATPHVPRRGCSQAGQRPRWLDSAQTAHLMS